MRNSIVFHNRFGGDLGVMNIAGFLGLALVFTGSADAFLVISTLDGDDNLSMSLCGGRHLFCIHVEILI